MQLPCPARFHPATWHDLTRLAATGRTRKLFDLCDVSCDRLRCDHELVAEGRLLSQAVEVSLCAVSLDAANGARVARMIVADGRLFNR